MEEMVEIMEDLQQYVPTDTTTSDFHTAGSDDPITLTLDDFHYTLFGKTLIYTYGMQNVVWDADIHVHLQL